MKPILLEIEGFNSFEKRQMIDFEELTSLGLFGIFGKTGSGKTSILDAIIYALYANIPRGANNIVHANTKKMVIRYIFEIKGVNAGRYEIQRSVSKGKSEDDSILAKSDGKKEAKLIKIKNDEAEIISDKKREVDSKIEEIIGLDYDDFVKTVVLPQGEFAGFLKVENKKRKNMLERIFSLRQYGEQLDDKIKKYKQKYEMQKKDYERELSGYENINEESIKLLEEEYERIKNEIKIADKTYEAMNILQKELKQLEILEIDYHETEKKFLKVKSQENEIENIKEECKKLSKFSQIQETIKSYKTLNELIPKMRDEFRETKNKLEEAEKQKEEKNKEKENIQLKIKEIPSIEKKIEELKKAIEVKENIKKIEREKQNLEEQLNKLHLEKENYEKTLQNKEKNQEKSKSQIENYEKIIEQNTYDIEYKEDIRKINTNIEKENEIKEECQLLEKEQEKLENSIIDEEKTNIKIDEDIKSINEDVKKLSAYTKNEIYTIEKYQQSDERQKKLENAQNIIIRNEKDIKQSQINIKENEENIKKISENIIKKTKEKEELQKELETQNKNKMIHHLKSSLKDGDECPICKSTYHIHQEILNEIPTEKDTKKIDEIDSDLSELNRKIAILQNENERYKTQISNLQEETNIYLEEFKGEDIQKELTICIKYKQDYTNYTKKEKEILEKLESKKNELSNLQTKLQIIRNNINNKQNQIGEIKQKLSEKYELSDKLSKHTTALSGKNNVDILKCKKILDEIIKSEQVIEQTNKKLQNYKKENVNFENDIKDLKEKLEKINNSIASIKIDIEKNKSQNSIEISKISDKSILDIENLQEEIKKAQDYILNIQNKFNHIEEEILNISQQVQMFSAKKIELETYGKIRRDEQEKCKNNLEDFRQSQNYASLEEILKLNEEYPNLEEKQKLVEKYDRDLIEISTQKDTALKKYNEQKNKTQNLQSEKKYDENEHRLLKENLDVMRKTYGYTENRLENEKAIFEKKKDILEKNLQNEKALGEIDEIEKLFRGKAFVQFLSKYQLSYVCKKASEILENISSGRFELSIDDEGEFIISDFQNGGIRRTPNTLSGGETFLVSLSLALALSSQVQLKGNAPLEFFFMDEGFGTLDSETLDIALDCLKRLKNDNLSIGIISHIDKIKEFVPIKLEISQDKYSNSSSIKIVKG